MDNSGGDFFGSKEDWFDWLDSVLINKVRNRRIATSAQHLRDRFDAIFCQKTRYFTFNLALKRIYNNKSELLRVLDRPEIPLHTNGSETDIRDYVKKKKVSGGTRSDEGRRCRDTFATLKKTC